MGGRRFDFEPAAYVCITKDLAADKPDRSALNVRTRQRKYRVRCGVFLILVPSITLIVPVY